MSFRNGLAAWEQHLVVTAQLLKSTTQIVLIWGRIKSPYLKYRFLFLSTYLFCVCVYVHVCVITGQLVEVGSLYLPRRLWGGTQVVRLSSKCLYLPRHLAGPEMQLLLSMYFFWSASFSC